MGNGAAKEVFMGNVRFGSNTSAYFQDSIEIPFFNYYLLGKGNDPKSQKQISFLPEKITGKNLIPGRQKM